MRRLAMVASTLLLVALFLFTPRGACAQGAPGSSTGGVVVNLSPNDDSAAPVAPANALRSLMQTYQMISRRWLAGLSVPVQRPSNRAALVNRRTRAQRNPAWAP